MLKDGVVAAKPDWKQLLTFLRGSGYKQILPWAQREGDMHKLIESTKLGNNGDQSVYLC